jgi:acetyl-CoA acetyltransferase
MRDVWIRGAAMTRFTRHRCGARELVEEAVGACLRDAELEPCHVQAAYVGNASAGIMSGQDCVRGQVVLRRTGLMSVPIVNVENACASSATALHLAWQAVAAELYDCVLVVGYEKMDGDRALRVRAMNASQDVEELAAEFGPDVGRDRNLYVAAVGTSTRFDAELASLLTVKNRYHGSLNELAHHREAVTVEQVLDSPKVAGSLNKMMCAPMTDGAACLLLCSSRFRRGRAAVARVAASVMVSGRGDDMGKPFSVGVSVRKAYDRAAAGPEDLDVVEMYDGTALAELYQYEDLGLCAEGEQERLVRDRVVWLGGRVPVNPSGGLLARGHPIGATGAAQVVELTWQLEGRCGARQVPGPRLAMAHVVGGWIGSDVAASCVHLLQK